MLVLNDLTYSSEKFNKLLKEKKNFVQTILKDDSLLLYFNLEPLTIFKLKGNEVKEFSFNHPYWEENTQTISSKLIAIEYSGLNTLAVAFENSVYLYSENNDFTSFENNELLCQEESKISKILFNEFLNLVCVILTTEKIIRIVSLVNKELGSFESTHEGSTKSVAFKGNWLITSGCEGDIHYSYMLSTENMSYKLIGTTKKAFQKTIP